MGKKRKNNSHQHARRLLPRVFLLPIWRHGRTQPGVRTVRTGWVIDQVGLPSAEIHADTTQSTLSHQTHRHTKRERYCCRRLVAPSSQMRESCFLSGLISYSSSFIFIVDMAFVTEGVWNFPVGHRERETSRRPFYFLTAISVGEISYFLRHYLVVSPPNKNSSLLRISCVIYYYFSSIFFYWLVKRRKKAGVFSIPSDCDTKLTSWAQ